jgi:hypothetical protein
MTEHLSCLVTYWLDLSAVFEVSGKQLQIRTAIYPLYVFPNVALWRSGSCPDASGP